MNILNWFKRKSIVPMSTQTLLDFFRMNGRARWFGHTYWNFATEAYGKNIIAYHCIKRISECCSDIPLRLMVNGKIVDRHPVLDLIKRPNPIQGWKTFIREAITHRLISGNSYIHGNIVSTGRVMELKNLRPDRVVILYTAYYEPYEFVYTYYGKVWHFPIEAVTQHSEVLHIKEPNPFNDLYGMSPIAAASMAVDQHNESSEWNKKLLENGAKPPGILTIRDKSESAPSMNKEQLALLREQLDEHIVGSKNAGKIPILNFDMVWQNLGMSPTDMDWISGKDSTAREICHAFGYPPHLLGIPDSSTYNNMAEAKLALYEETVIPLLQNFLEEISYFINYHQNPTGKPQGNIELIPDLDQVSALIPRRESARATARADLLAGLVTINEARAESNYQPVNGGDEIMVPLGRVPLNFDSSATNLDKEQYEKWLLVQGFDKDFSKKLTEMAYANN